MFRSLVILVTTFAWTGLGLADDSSKGSVERGSGGTVAHPHDPVLQAEHMDMLALIPDDTITHRAVADGRWSEPATWKDGKIPPGDANVLIPRGKTVTLDKVLSEALRTVRVDGKLEFVSDRDTCLLVDTMVVTPGGELVIGTDTTPIASDKRARIIFADRGPIDANWDANQLSRGLISHGNVSIVGAAVTSFVALARQPHKGDTKLVLTKVLSTWKKGDRLILPGTKPTQGKDGKTQDEELTVLGIDNNEVTVRPLEFDHSAPKDDLMVYVGNLTRNISLESQNKETLSRRGHVMFMHSPRVILRYCGFYDLGRTDKRIPVDDVRLDDKKKLISGSGTNPRGRYPVHFHRTGADVQIAAIPVKGCAVVNSPGWGYVNHSSHVEMEDNIAYNIDGAAFVTEAGDEVGAFRRNLAVRSVGSGHDTVARNDIQDFGHEGSGFWLQGGGVAVEDNVACGHRDAAYFFFTSGLIEDGLGRRGFLVSNVPEAQRCNNVKSPKEKQPDDCMSLNYLPLFSCKGNTAFACGTGITVRFHTPPVTRSVIEDCKIWRTTTGVRIVYSDNIHLKNLELIGDGKSSHTGIAQASEAIGGAIYENLTVEGWQTGLAVSDIVAKSQVIDGGYYNNKVNIALALAYIYAGRVDEVKGPIRFGPKSERDISLQINYDAFYSRDPNVLFLPHVVRIDTKQYPKRQLYFADQGADSVPLKAEQGGKFRSSAKGHVPDELIGKTNRELFDKYRLAIAGAVAPADTKKDAKIDGLVGDPCPYAKAWILHNVYSKELKDYRPNCTAAGQTKKTGPDVSALDLERGWNLITCKLDDRTCSFLVFGGDRPQGKKGSYEGGKTKEK